MDVRCDRCQTEYELDEMRLTASGVAVKCTNCGNVFKVRRNAAEEIVPAKQKVREWHVRRQDGTTLTLRELTDLQKAVVERKVAPEDSVSLSGESWHQLGAMPELASFFEVVEAAKQAQSAQRPPASAARAQMSPAGAPQPSPKSGPRPSGDSGLGRSQTPMWGDGPQSFGPTPVGAEPAWAAAGPGQGTDPELKALLEKEDLQAMKNSGRGFLIVLVLLLVAAGGAAAYFFLLHGSGGAPGTLVMVPPPPPDVNAPVIAPIPEPKPSIPKPAEPEPVPPKALAAAPVPAPAPAAPTPAPPTPPAAVAAATPASKVGPKPKAEKADDDQGSAPAGKSFDYYISQGHKLLDNKPTQALALFEKAAELDPRSPEPDSGRGLAYENMERLGDASNAFQAALKKSSEFTEAIMGLAEVSRAQGNARKAIGLYQRYLDLTPDGSDAPVARAQLEQLKSTVAAQAPAPKAVAATPVAPSEPAPQVAAPPAPVPQAAPVEAAPPPVVVPDQPAQ